MSRYRNDDLAYGDIPQRWDRERFERLGAAGGRGPPPSSRYEEDFQFTERDRPGRRDIAVMDRVESRGPRGAYDERDRYFEETRRAPSRPRRRTDRELFGELDPRELADMQLVPRRKSISREDFDIDRRAPRPGLLRRQSSLDTFDRRPGRYEPEEYRMAPYTPVPLPIRRHRHEYDDDRHYREYERYYEPAEGYREVEIQRERSIHRKRAPKSEKSAKRSESSSSSSSSSASSESEVKLPSRAASKAPSKAPSTKKAKSVKAPTTILSESSLASLPPAPPPPAPIPVHSVHETLIEESIHEERRFKKGKTRMPKRLVRVEAIMDLGYPFEEEESFYVLQIALEKEQIDEVIKISEQYKDGEKKKIYRFEQTEEVLPPPLGEHETVERTEWINPPTVIDRRGSPSAKSSISQMPRSRSRRPSSPGTYVSKHQTVIEESRSPPPAPLAPPPPPLGAEYYEERKTIVEERVPSHHHHAGSLVLSERHHQSDRDINHEIRALEAERRALRLERDAEQKRDLAMRLRDPTQEEFQLVQYRDRSRSRGDLVVYEREKSPPRNVIRVEKDRKERRKAKLLAAAMATLS